MKTIKVESVKLDVCLTLEIECSFESLKKDVGECVETLEDEITQLSILLIKPLVRKWFVPENYLLKP